MAYYKFLNQIKKSKKIIIYGGKKSIRSFTYIDDVVYSINLLIKKFSKKNIMNASTLVIVIKTHYMI